MRLKTQLRKAHSHTTKAAKRLEKVQQLVEQTPTKAAALDAPIAELYRVRGTIRLVANREHVKL